MFNKLPFLIYSSKISAISLCVFQLPAFHSKLISKHLCTALITLICVIEFANHLNLLVWWGPTHLALERMIENTERQQNEEGFSGLPFF